MTSNEAPDGDMVPVFRARLPATAAILPYLQQLDGSRRYTNRGDLAVQFETRLRAALGLGDALLVSAASGTAALQAAILAAAGRARSERPVAIIPAYTFVATALAAEACGYTVVFADIAPADWMLDAVALRRHPALAEAGLVLPVAPYGVAHTQAQWVDFMAATGIPVVIDAAASFAAIRRDPTGTTGDIPVALSFQATKCFSTGEGGGVIWNNLAGLARVVQSLNFGFLGTRSCRAPGFNGKMSEYHAAVGLASLDGLAAAEAARASVTAEYATAAALRGIAGLVLPPVIASNYALFDAVSPRRAMTAVSRLQDAGIDHRFWYGRGVHQEPYFANGSRLPEAEALAARLIGIPMFDDLAPAEIERTVDALANI